MPGNVRELANAIEHAVILSDGKTIHAEDLPTSVGGKASQAHARPFLVTNFARALTLDEIEEEAILQTSKSTRRQARRRERAGDRAQDAVQQNQSVHVTAAGRLLTLAKRHR